MKSPRLLLLDYAIALQLSGSHAVFNYLTGIQNKIILDDKLLAINGLSEFAKFKRLIMRLPELEKWTLKEEWHLLSAYAQMEQDRFSSSLKIEMQSQELPPAFVPVLLLAPFMETILAVSASAIKGDRKVLLTVKDSQPLVFSFTVNGEITSFSYPTAKEEFKKRWMLFEEKCALLGAKYDLKTGKTRSIFTLTIHPL